MHGCPYCGSNNVDTEVGSFDTASALIGCGCQGCGREWMVEMRPVPRVRALVRRDANLSPHPWYYAVFNADDVEADSIDYGSCGTWTEAMACVEHVVAGLRRNLGEAA